MEDLPPESVESAPKEITRRGYDATGYNVQYVYNALNDILGIDGWRLVDVTPPVLTKGADGWHEASRYMRLELLRDGVVWAERSSNGTNRSKNQGDALKGAKTTCAKRAAAEFGLGWRAYAGQIDPEFLPQEDVPTHHRNNGNSDAQKVAKAAQVVAEVFGAPENLSLALFSKRVEAIGGNTKRALEFIERTTGKPFGQHVNGDRFAILEIIEGLQTKKLSPKDGEAQMATIGQGGN